jgi:parallel beta-helix repeat protein
MISQIIHYFRQNNLSVKNAFIIIFLVFHTIASATDYYISSTGNDANNGLSSSTPWKTVAKVNSVFSTLKPGDRILFNRSDIFFGTIIISKSGSADSPITIGDYGNGENPIITGFTTITGWTYEGGGIYSKVIPSSAATEMVTIDGVQYGMGRIPNTGWYSYESCVTNVSITDNQLGASPNWTGAELVIRKNDWTVSRANITKHSSNTLTYANAQSGDNGTAGFGYFIQNDLRTLDALGEWYHDYSGTGKFYMYFGAVDPSTKVVKVATLNNVLTNTGGYDYITISGLSFIGSIGTGLNFGSGTDYCIIKNCNISFSGENGITIGSSYSTIDNNNISYSNNCAIQLSDGSHQTITNNDIENISLIYGSDRSKWPSHNGIMFNNPGITSVIIEYNTMRYIGASGIAMFNGLTDITIKHNYIDYAMYRTNDGGGIYNYGISHGIIIKENIVSNSVGNIDGTAGSVVAAHGIYLDNGSSNVTISGNTCFGCSWSGIFIHKAHDNIIEYNTCYNNASDQLLFSNFAGGGALYNNPVNNNIFFAKTSTQKAMRLMTTVHNIDDAAWQGDYNYYTRPIDDSNVIYMSSLQTLAQFKTTVSPQESHSAKSTQTVTTTDVIQFFYNATKTNKVITLNQPMIDVKDTKYTTNITLLPFSSVILMVDSNPSASTANLIYVSSVVQDATPDILEIIYNLSLANIMPAASAFSVRVNSVVRTVNAVGISGTKVQLTLESPILYGDVVTVSDTKPSSNLLQTASGGQAVTISNQPVINNCMNVAPAVVITSPINNSSFTTNANIAITANASDPDGSISMVEFYSGSIKIGSMSSAPYLFTWNNVPAGTYSLTVIATDNLNTKTISSAISITVTNGTTSGNQPPVITISDPRKGNKYDNPATITIDAVASDPDGTINKVEFYCGAVKLVELTSAPYTYTWKNVSAGTYTITAIATDNLNSTTVSSPVEFVVGANIKYDANSEIINLYPNPSDGHFSIKFINPLQNDKSEIIITDLAGKQVYSGPILKEETLKQFDLSNIKSGIYVMMIICEELLVTKKFIIN